jgi:hypothetical protein
MNNIKSNLWNVMKNISSTYYFLDKFERQKDNQFIENTDELSIIGKEMFDMFDFKKKDIFFVDICGAPGMYSKILVEDKDAKGFSISLPPEKGGVEYIFKHDNYKIYYKDILEKNYKIDTHKKINLGLASCVSYIESRNSHALNLELIISSMSLMLDILEEDGDIIINMTMKNIYTCFNILDLLIKQFNNIKLWKSTNVWATKNTFYIFCYGFKKDKMINMTQYINYIKNDKSDFNTKYIGDFNNISVINKMMINIYKVRINAWVDLISNEDLKKALY